MKRYKLRKTQEFDRSCIFCIPFASFCHVLLKLSSVRWTRSWTSCWAPLDHFYSSPIQWSTASPTFRWDPTHHGHCGTKRSTSSHSGQEYYANSGAMVRRMSGPVSIVGWKRALSCCDTKKKDGFGLTLEFFGFFPNVFHGRMVFPYVMFSSWKKNTSCLSTFVPPEVICRSGRSRPWSWIPRKKRCDPATRRWILVHENSSSFGPKKNDKKKSMLSERFILFFNVRCFI